MIQQAVATAVETPDPTLDDPFYWGSRYMRAEDPDGTTRLVEVPLTRADVLDPQQGDMYHHDTDHQLFIRRLAVTLELWLDAEDVAIYNDVKIRWPDPSLPEPAPDVAIIRGIRDKRRRRGSFSVLEERTAPCLVIEVISPRYREIDEVDKVAIYARAGVPEYLIVDVTTTPIALTGYHLDASDRYRKESSLPWTSRETGLRFAPGKKPLEIVIRDVATGHRLLDLLEVTALRHIESAALRFSR